MSPQSKYSDASSSGTEAANLRSGSRRLMYTLRFSVEYGFSGEAKMLRLPRAERAELHASLEPGDDLVIPEPFNRRLNDFVVGHQIPVAQFAVLEHLLDLVAVVFRSEEKAVERFAAIFTKDLVPGVERASHAGTGVAGGGLHPNVVEASRGLDRRHEQGIEHQAAAETQVLALAGHTGDGLFDGALQAGGEINAGFLR